MKYVIFEIDDGNDGLVQEKFDDLIAWQKSRGRITGNVVKARGGWEGQESPAFIMTLKDFDAGVRPSGFVDHQDAFLHVTECNKKYCQLEWRDGHAESMGSLMHVSKEVAMQAPGYTYRPDQDAYYVCVDGNNDHIPGKPLPPFAVSVHHLVEEAEYV